MNRSVIRYLAVGWMGTTVCLNLIQAVAAAEPEPKPQITVYVYSWEQVEPNTLREAKEVATHIFRKAGVEATLLDGPLSSEEEHGKVVPERRRSPNFFVHIVGLSMAENFGLPTQVLGIAPGTPQEPNRDLAYVFDHVAERMALEQLQAREDRSVFMNANKGYILGHGIAHEIGHVLLQASHSPAGLMRAQWTRPDFLNMVGRNLHFTSEEAERVRAEVRRRNERKWEVASGE